MFFWNVAAISCCKKNVLLRHPRTPKGIVPRNLNISVRARVFVCFHVRLIFSEILAAQKQCGEAHEAISLGTASCVLHLSRQDLGSEPMTSSVRETP